MTDPEIIAVVQARIDGKQIQAQYKREYRPWVDVNPIEWDFINYNFRAKPEPREIWVVEITNGCYCGLFTNAAAAIMHSPNQKIVHFREVIE